jgi:hypothetical protein
LIPNLLDLGFCDVRPEHLVACASCWANLQRLKIRSATFIHFDSATLDSGVLALAKYCTQLQAFELGWITPETAISARPLSMLIRNNPSLHSVWLSFADMDDAELTNALAKVNSVRLVYCINVSDLTLDAISAPQSKVRSLYIHAALFNDISKMGLQRALEKRQLYANDYGQQPIEITICGPLLWTGQEKQELFEKFENFADFQFRF